MPDGLQSLSRLKSDLQKLHTWANIWLHSIHKKTEVMVFSNSVNIVLPAIIFDTQLLNIVDDHTHLGITFNSSCRWNAHIATIIKRCTKQIGTLRKFKYLLSRRNLSKIYTTFIRPVLEYASEVWDGCGQVNSERLDRLQLEVGRIVTGLPVFVSSESILTEC
jgi:hypothetical protein